MKPPLEITTIWRRSLARRKGPKNSRRRNETDGREESFFRYYRWRTCACLVQNEAQGGGGGIIGALRLSDASLNKEKITPPISNDGAGSPCPYRAKYAARYRHQNPKIEPPGTNWVTGKEAPRLPFAEREHFFGSKQKMKLGEWRNPRMPTHKGKHEVKKERELSMKVIRGKKSHENDPEPKPDDRKHFEP
ncbi:hypothetical protein BDQ17DRAFT_1322220 [Cyathus striatus]|nr:hypothetical protein BDQ17DRAFT_1322220 [Cyathus striatus]